MLHIELQLIHLIEAELVRQLLQVVEILDPASGDIMVKSSVFHIGLIINLHKGQKSRILAHDLAQGLYGPAKRIQASAHKERSLLRYVQSIAMLAQRSIGAQ